MSLYVDLFITITNLGIKTSSKYIFLQFVITSTAVSSFFFFFFLTYIFISHLRGTSIWLKVGIEDWVSQVCQGMLPHFHSNSLLPKARAARKKTVWPENSQTFFFLIFLYFEAISDQEKVAKIVQRISVYILPRFHKCSTWPGLLYLFLFICVFI